MDNFEIRETQTIVREYNSIVTELIRKLNNCSISEDELAVVDRVKKRIFLLSSTMGNAALLAECGPFFLRYKDQIIHRDEGFFMTANIEKEAAGLVKQGDEFIYTLVNMIRQHYKRSDQAEKDYLYGKLHKLYDDYLEYELSLPDENL